MSGAYRPCTNTSRSMKPLLILLALTATAATAQTSATYRVTFESTWSAATHPAAFPSNAHFSPLVGATHDASVSFWTEGALATPGIEAMAERGQNAMLVQELTDAGAATGVVVDGPGLNTSPGTAERQILVSSDHPLVTLVTMLAPSPDWFVGVHGVDLRDGAGWTDRLVVPLRVADAGTDSGVSYGSPDADTQPRAPVTLQTQAPFADGTPVGTLTFECLTPAASDDGADPAGFALSPAAPNPARRSASLTLTLDRPQSVSVRVLDALGRTVAVLADGPQSAGHLALRLDTAGLAAGVYTVVAAGETAHAAQRVSVVR